MSRHPQCILLLPQWWNWIQPALSPPPFIIPEQKSSLSLQCNLFYPIIFDQSCLTSIEIDNFDQKICGETIYWQLIRGKILDERCFFIYLFNHLTFYFCFSAVRCVAKNGPMCTDLLQSVLLILFLKPK